MQLDAQPDSGFRAIGATPYLCPLPAVMLACADPERGIRPNIITVAWTGVVCSKPPMISVSIKKERYSYELIRRTGEFTVNLVSRELCRALDYCGVKSGRDGDKFAACKLTPIIAPPLTSAPAIAQCPAHLLCRVDRVIPLGSHDLFLANVIQVSVQERYFTDTGAIDEGRMGLVSYVHGKYRSVCEELGFFGYAVAGEEARRRRMNPVKNTQDKSR